MVGEIQIPGYYYDEAKKRYFKITKDYKPKPPPPPASKKTKKNDEDYLPELLLHRSLCGSNKLSLKRLYQGIAFKNLKLDVDFLSFPGDDNDTFDDNFVQSMKVNKDGTELFVAKRMTLIIYKIVIEEGELKIADDPNSNSITSMHYGGEGFSPCWSPWSPNDFLFCYSKYKLLRPEFLTKSSVMVLKHFDSGLQKTKVFKNKEITACDWCRHFSYERCVALCESAVVIGNSKMTVTTIACDRPDLPIKHRCNVNSKATTIKTFQEAPTQLVGLKSGNISLIDCRMERNTEISVPEDCRCCIDCLRIQKDENYATISNWNGSVYTVDLRMRKRVQTYRGHINNSATLEFHFDANEDVIYAVGSDGYLRTWDVRTTQLQYQKQLDCRRRNSLPVISYSNSWAGNERFSGLLISLGNEYQFFPGT